jgi:hypothetical protein
MRKGLLVVMAVAAAGVAASLSTAAAKPGFAPGTWVGSGTQKGVFSVVPGSVSPVDGRASFALKVSSSRRASGTLTLKTRMAVDHAGMHGVVLGSATVPLTGSGSELRYAGTMKLSGKLSDGKLTLPFALAKPFSGRFLITRADCLSVAGKTDSQLAFAWKAVPKPGTPRPRCD